jgi:hypothetical protein
MAYDFTVLRETYSRAPISARVRWVRRYWSTRRSAALRLCTRVTLPQLRFRERGRHRPQHRRRLHDRVVGGPGVQDEGCARRQVRHGAHERFEDDRREQDHDVVFGEGLDR